MYKLEKIDLFKESVNDLLFHTDRLCYISQGPISIGDTCLNCESHGLVMFFNPKPETCDFDKQNISYYSQMPKLDSDYIILVIEDYLAISNYGIEDKIHQKDGWLRNDQLIRDNRFITLEMVNNGACCWLYNTKTNEVLDKNTYLYQILSKFDNHEISSYQIKNI